MGAAGSATSYIGNGLFTGDLSFGEGFTLTSYFDSKFNASNRYDGTDITKAGLKPGDIVAWGVDENSMANYALKLNQTVSKYKNRPYKILARYKPSLVSFSYERGNGDYNIFVKNCTSQASIWTGSSYRNNPGAFCSTTTGQHLLMQGISNIVAKKGKVFVNGKTEDPPSATMQSWGFYNYKP